MSEAESKPIEKEEESELTKEQRLEAARKKFEELKKKKKKDKKKKAKKEDTNADDEDEQKDKGDVSESKEDTPLEEVKSGSGAFEENSVEQKEEKKSDTFAEKEKSVEVADEDRKPENKQTIEEEKDTAVEGTQTESPSVPLSSHDLDSIKSDSLVIEELQKTIEEQKRTIAVLRKEVKDLKLSKMDLDDTIADLRSENEQLKRNAISSQSPSSNKSTSSHKAPMYKPAKPLFTTNDYASSSQQNLSKFSSIEDFREKLMIWKGWQVDMRSWSSPNSTKAVL